MKNLVIFTSLFLFSCLSCNDKVDLAENNLFIVDQYFDSWNQGDSIKLATFYSDDFLHEDVAYKVHIQSDKSQLVKLVNETITMIPDTHFDIVEKTANDSMVVIEWVWTGTLEGATRPFTGRGVSVVKLKDGKIVRNTDYYPLDFEYILEAQQNLASQSLQ